MIVLLVQGKWYNNYRLPGRHRDTCRAAAEYFVVYGIVKMLILMICHVSSGLQQNLFESAKKPLPETQAFEIKSITYDARNWAI
ncbi:MAG: hypothetical protein ACKVT0_08205 [Planctomycetaceae bacterium]